MELVLDAVLEALTRAGVPAVERFPATPLDRKAPVVCVAVESESVTSSGLGRYLGEFTLEDGERAEVYGWKSDVTVLLELYLPRQADARALFVRVARALEGLPAGLHPRRVTRGALTPDGKTGMFCCPCTLECTAFFARIEGEDAVRWSDFTVKGVLHNE